VKIVHASEVTKGTRFYYPQTVGGPLIEVALDDAVERPDGSWLAHYDGSGLGSPWPAVFPGGNVAVPEPGDGPAPLVWSDRHMDGWG
jgi:hypothetical protein